MGDNVFKIVKPEKIKLLDKRPQKQISILQDADISSGPE